MTDSGENRPQAWCWAGFLAMVLVMFLSLVFDRGGNRAIELMGVGAVLVAPLFFVPPFILLKRHGGPDPGRPFHETNVLVERGVYRFVRHPQYLGYILLILGFAARSQHLATALPAIIAVAGMHGQAVAEDRFCRRNFGAEFVEYAARVPMYNVPLGLWRLYARRGAGS